MSLRKRVNPELKIGPTMTADCIHQVGFIPDAPTTAAEWNERLAAFIAKVEDLNVRGQRDQISHPGHIAEFKFCPDCGQSIDRAALTLLTYSQAFELHVAAGASNKDQNSCLQGGGTHY